MYNTSLFIPNCASVNLHVQCELNHLNQLCNEKCPVIYVVRAENIFLPGFKDK